MMMGMGMPISHNRIPRIALLPLFFGRALGHASGNAWRWWIVPRCLALQTGIARGRGVL
jgi:hypothetical protein